MVHVIQQLSKYGFKVDSLKNDWEKVDKSLVSSNIFSELVVGSSIEVLERNKKGFITSIKIVGNGYDSKPSVNDRNILKGQCLNIVFANLSAQDVNLENDKMREQGIRYAQKLFVELEVADYYKW